MYKLIPWQGDSSNDEFIILSGEGTTGDKSITVVSPSNKSLIPRSKTIELYTTYPSETVTQQVKIVQEGYQIPVNTVYNFGYTQDIEGIQLTKGAYRLQVWGAQGGANEADAQHNITSQPGGKGGYSEGILLLNEPTTVYITVGGQPDLINNPTYGGFNGGGGGASGTSSYGKFTDTYGAVISKAGGGGGATDISLVGSEIQLTDSRMTKTTASLLSRFIIAGGGSGGAMCEKQTYSTRKSWVNVATVSNLAHNATGTVNDVSYTVSQSGSATGQYGYVTQLYFSWDELVFNDGDKIRITYQNTASDARVRVYWSPETGSGNSQVDIVSSSYTSPLVFTENNNRKPNYRARLTVQLYTFQLRYQGPIIIEKESDYSLLITEFPTNTDFYPNSETGLWVAASTWRGYVIDVTPYRGQLLTLTPQISSGSAYKYVQCTFYKTPPVAGQAPDYATGVTGWSHRGQSIGKVIVPSDAVYVYFLTDAGTAGGNERTPASAMFQEYDVVTETMAQIGYAGGGITGDGYTDAYKGKQTSAGTNGGFGIGSNLRGDGNNRYMPGAGGGGWYGGGSAVSQSTSDINSIKLCGGGSGFVNTSANASSRPANYTGLELFSGTTYAGTETFESPDGDTETGHEGNGYARITAIDEYEYRYFTVEALDDSTFKLDRNALLISKDNGQTWTTLAANETCSLNIFEKAWIKQTNPTISSSYGIGTFTITGNVKVSGNIMSLLYGDNFTGQVSLSGKNHVFRYLFNNCTSLTDAENIVLPATTLSQYCYYEMFAQSGITKGPKVLPATTMQSYCYYGMFNGTRLVKAPDMKATVLADYCFYRMFYHCGDLTEAPVLYADSIGIQYCCYQMFIGCNLNHVICLASTFPSNGNDGSMQDWLTDNSLTGVLEIKKNQTSAWNTAKTVDSTIVPSGWTLKELDYPYDYRDQYFIMTVKSGTGKVYLNIPSDLSVSNYEYIEWSTDASVWHRVDNADNQAVRLETSTLNTGDSVYFRGSGVRMSTASGISSSTFTSDNNMEIILSGKLMALCETDRVASYMFKELFRTVANNLCFISVKDLTFPDTTNEGCFEYMFSGQAITDVPKLPALVMSRNCYSHMFESTLITKTPELPAMDLAISCYSGMFYSCLNLTEGPESLTGKLKTGCYDSMFQNTGITEPPALPEVNTDNAGECYASMFADCTDLEESPILVTKAIAGQDQFMDIFDNSTNVKKVTVLTPESEIDWSSLGSGGTLYKNPLLDTTGLSPSWQIINDYENTYFTIESLVDNNAIQITNSSNIAGLSLSVSTDCITWTDINIGNGTTTLATLNTGGVLCMAGNNARYTNGSTSTTCRIVTSGNFNVYGNIMSLIYGHNFYGQKTLTETYTFTSLFYQNTNLISAQNLILPAVNLTSNCYRSMFNRCSSMVRGPKLPAMNLVENCYFCIFYNCSSLTRIDAMFYTTPGNTYTPSWVESLLGNGVFVKNNKATWTNTTGVSAVPSGWTIRTMPYDTEILVPFEVLENTVISQSDGSLLSGNYGFIRKYKVTAGETYYATAYAPGTTVYYINWMDGQGNRIGADLNGSGTANITWEDEPVTAPVGAIEMWMNCRYPNYASNKPYIFVK